MKKCLDLPEDISN